MCGLVAATAATAWPQYSTLSTATKLPMRNLRGIGTMPGTIVSSTSGKSAEVTTASTPGSASAFETSIFLMMAWAYGLFLIRANSMRGR